MKKLRRPIVVSVIALSFVAACGGAERAPNSAVIEAPKEEKARATASGQAAPATAAAPQDESPPGVRAARVQAKADMDKAQRELDVAAADCGTACRALLSLERSTSRLCELVISDSDTADCEESKRAAKRARDRVRSTCGTCPAGTPSLEPDAPLSH